MKFHKGDRVLVDWYEDMDSEGIITAVSYMKDRFTVKLTNGDDAGDEYVFDIDEVRAANVEPTPNKINDWRDHPATGKQLEYLVALGIEFYPEENLTKGRASELIDAAKRDELGSVGGWYTDGSN